MDRELRNLERLAAGGDAEAAARLERARGRAGARAGQVSQAALGLATYLGVAGEPAPRLRRGQDVYVDLGPRRLSASEQIRKGLARGSGYDAEWACGKAPPAAALALLLLLDELEAPEGAPHYRHLLLGRWVQGIGAWGHEACLRAGLAAIRRAEQTPDEARAVAALAAWLESPGEEALEAFRTAAGSLSPNLSGSVNYSGTGNTDAYDEALDRWERWCPVSKALQELAFSFRTHEPLRREYAGKAVARLVHVPARELEQVIRSDVREWAATPDARVETPSPATETALESANQSGAEAAGPGLFGRIVASLRRALGG